MEDWDERGDKAKGEAKLKTGRKKNDCILRYKETEESILYPLSSNSDKRASEKVFLQPLGAEMVGWPHPRFSSQVRKSLVSCRW